MLSVSFQNILPCTPSYVHIKSSCFTNGTVLYHRLLFISNTFGEPFHASELVVVKWGPWSLGPSPFQGSKLSQGAP